MIPEIRPKCHKLRLRPVLAVDRAMIDAPEKGAAAISQGIPRAKESDMTVVVFDPERA
ncbi:hypothetical protein ACQPZ8_33995 [Actinomadura nitritigenes]|uniref:hypothetical protein n=1 Tax=Actinomadura nitritigenes TaxID=134602 RepID=UPI003D8F95A6